MRIISQDGRFDVPYELCAVYLSTQPMKGTAILCRWQADQKSANLLAEYLSEENALAAMQMLHDAFNRRDIELSGGKFTHYDCIFRFPSNKEMEEKTTEGDHKMVDVIAEKLNGVEYGDRFPDIVELAKENGVVICFGESDDLIEFEGAIRDEAGCFDGGDVHFTKNGFVNEGDQLRNKITAVWCGKVDNEPAWDPSEFQAEGGEMITWCYKTDIPHKTFMMYEDNEPYCRGIVFALKDVK